MPKTAPHYPQTRHVKFLDKWHLLETALADPNLTKADVRLLQYVIDRYQEEWGYAVCSNRHTTAALGLSEHSEKNVRNSFKKLVSNGYLFVHMGDTGRANRYVPVLHKAQKLELPSDGGSDDPQVGVRRPSEGEGQATPQYPLSSPVMNLHLVPTYARAREGILDISTSTTEENDPAPKECANEEAWVRAVEQLYKKSSTRGHACNPDELPIWLQRLYGFDPWAIGIDIARDDLGIRKPEVVIRRSIDKWVINTNKNIEFWPKNPQMAVKALTTWLTRERW